MEPDPALAPCTDQDSSVSAPSVCLQVELEASSVLLADLDPTATAALLDKTVVPAVLAQAVFRVVSHRAVVRAVPYQAVVLEDSVSALEAELEFLALASEEVPEAVLLPLGVDRDLPLPAPETFPADPPSWAANKAQVRLALAAATVASVDFPIMATAMTLLVWAAATD